MTIKPGHLPGTVHLIVLQLAVAACALVVFDPWAAVLIALSSHFLLVLADRIILSIVFLLRKEIP